jgi:hypothetical protein
MVRSTLEVEKARAGYSKMGDYMAKADATRMQELQTNFVLNGCGRGSIDGR